jgi:hypothetical protein
MNNEVLFVGGTYVGSKITKLEEVVSDRGPRIRTRSTITLDNGMIVTLDSYVDKAEGDDQEAPSNKSIPNSNYSIPKDKTKQKSRKAAAVKE